LRYGFKAQDVLELEGSSPVIVDAEDEDKLRLNDQSLIAVLVNALKELNEKVDSDRLVASNALRDLNNKFDAYVLTHP
jgi:hypothetical protein